MSTLRLFRVVAVVLIAASVIGACAAPATSDTVSFMIFGDPAELKAYQALASAFEQKHASIKIELIHIPSQSDYRKRMAADFAAGTPANIVLINYRRYAGFAAKGVIEPIEPYLAKSNVIKIGDFYEEAIQPFMWQGQLLCVPQNLSSLVIYYNVDLFKAANVPEPANGWTWDNFLSAAQALTKDLDGDGRIDQYGVGLEASLIRAAPFIWQNGGELVDTPVARRLTIDTPQAQAALQWLVDLQLKHHVVPDAAAEKSEDSETRFMNGRTAMYFDSRRATPTFREITAFNWDVAPLPQRTAPASVLHSDAYCLTTGTTNKDAAWTFIEFANSVEGQTLVAKSGRTVPSLKAVAQSAAFLEPGQKPARSQIFLDALPSMRTLPILTNWVDIEEVFGAEFERAFYNGAPLAEVVQAIVERTLIFFTETE
ncbi:MAG: sugar ABC transporter substrate-binding protein [Thermoflexales bacterium]|nr:sugar ABC transporter substrate-binding protein [Thermoflexales bacterium]